VLGGVAARTREAIALCEATGFDVVLVETIGVGQSEVAVAGMVDFLLLLAMPGAGDDLQGIKRGITELADAVFVNKADGERRPLAEQTRGDFEQALALLRGHDAVPVLLGSAQEDIGMAEAWQAVEAHRARLGTAGLRQKRETQAQAWFEEAVGRLLVERFLADPAGAARW
jgi:LAO/AO transport system kinase